ncbi:DUF2281 domain-containing protein [Tychonema sp. BBK16]|uniref:type II toxin-antitoxin system VapB family antitoxin n=1 Tax=Tychonema sp. BBK16 TaxID=2699888 RepID=UPI001F1F3B23|nr:DUF2281 domain-containing protein [Tychonema sp. BBK16]MCF6374354.1 DUF2281 domain-containing protein [Tychonema sp. BBK16]
MNALQIPADAILPTKIHSDRPLLFPMPITHKRRSPLSNSQPINPTYSALFLTKSFPLPQLSFVLQIFQTVVKMPESLKQEILHYAKYLLEKHAKTESSPEQLEQPHGYGTWAGQIVMSDDFDEPLEDLKEYTYNYNYTAIN